MFLSYFLITKSQYYSRVFQTNANASKILYLLTSPQKNLLNFTISSYSVGKNIIEIYNHQISYRR